MFKMKKTISHSHLPNIFARESSFSSSRSLNRRSSSSFFFFSHKSLKIQSFDYLVSKHFDIFEASNFNSLALLHDLNLAASPPLLALAPLQHVDVGQRHPVKILVSLQNPVWREAVIIIRARAEREDIDTAFFNKAIKKISI